MLISKTPLRISFFSGGSDMPSFYQKEDGAALSATINKYIYVIVHKTPNLGVRIMYDSVEEFSDVEQMHHLITKETLKYYNINKEVTIASISDITSKGSGLGSSSAFTVGLVNAIASYKWEIASKKYLADMACIIEMEKCGYPVGKQDQYAAAYGGFNLFRFHKDEEVTTENLTFDKNVINNLESKLLLVYSGKGRSANSILQKQQKAMSDKDKFNLVKRSRDKAFIARDYLSLNQLDDFGNLLHEAWMDKKGVVSEISQDYFDVIYDKAMKSGALGGKLMGAGGGGFFLFYVPENKRENVIHEITSGTECKVHDFGFSYHGSRITTSMIN